MSQIKGKNTKVEILFRKNLWKKGIRGYRIHSKITGKPDIYFPSRKIAIFLDGCFWHQCSKCFKPPKTNNRFWEIKLGKNVLRDRQVCEALEQQGVKVLRFWQHEIKENPDLCLQKIKDCL